MFQSPDGSNFIQDFLGNNENDLVLGNLADANVVLHLFDDVDLPIIIRDRSERNKGGIKERGKRVDQNKDGKNHRDQTEDNKNRLRVEGALKPRDQSKRYPEDAPRIRTDAQKEKAKKRREENKVVYNKGVIEGRRKESKKKEKSKMKIPKGMKLSIFAGDDGNSESITSQKFVPIESQEMIDYMAFEWHYVVAEGTARSEVEERYLEFKQFRARQSSLQTATPVVIDRDGGDPIVPKRKRGVDGLYQVTRRKKILKHKEKEFVTLLESPEYEKVFMKVATKRFRDKYFSTMDLLRAMDGSSTNTMNLSAVEMFKELTKLDRYEKGIVPSQALMSFDAHALEIAMELLVPGILYVTMITFLCF
jgi:hypothetical protein